MLREGYVSWAGDARRWVGRFGLEAAQEGVGESAWPAFGCWVEVGRPEDLLEMRQVGLQWPGCRLFLR